MKTWKRGVPNLGIWSSVLCKPGEEVFSSRNCNVKMCSDNQVIQQTFRMSKVTSMLIGECKDELIQVAQIKEAKVI